jgi:hypothetical protein
VQKFLQAASIPLLLAGCTNLTAVSNFASSGATATNSTDVFAGYVDAEKAAVTFAYSPTDNPTPTQIQDRANAQNLVDQAPTIAAIDEAGLKVLSLYLTTLSKLSSNTAINVNDSAKSIGSSLTSLGAVPSTETTATQNLINLLISAPLDAWRNKAVGNLIQNANNNVITLCTDLSTSAKAIAEAWNSDIFLVEAYYAGVPGPTNDIRGSILMMSLASQQAQTFSQNQQKATALADALTSVCKGQDTMAKNANSLNATTVEGILTGYQAEISSAVQIIH